MNHRDRATSGPAPATLSWAAAGLALLLSACASTAPPPREQMAVSKAAVENASGQGAAEAPAELALARDKMARAQLAYNNQDYQLARQLAEQAEADALLAEARARSVRAGRAVAEVRESIRQLRAEITRSTS